MKSLYFLIFLAMGISISSCTVPTDKGSKMVVLMDSDANNELDDQHALAYLFFNGNTFEVAGVTVNTTFNGGDINDQYTEAKRVMQLCNVFETIPLFKGANGSFMEIRPFLNQDQFDGHQAVNFIIAQAHKERKEKLILLPVGKLTNIALALDKDSSIASKIRIVWLGSNYPKKGEYNLENDMEAVNFVLSKEVSFEMVTVRSGENSGSGHVSVGREFITSAMPGLGPYVSPVEGRHGGSFSNFGDYSVNLFEHCDYYGDPPSRSLFDMVAVAILKNPSFGESVRIPAPVLSNGEWVEQPDNKRMITIWENFDKDAILNDFQNSMKNFVITNKEK